MKILHLVGGDLRGGAAKGALWLHAGLQALGVESRILTNGKDTLGDPDITSIATTSWQLITNAFRARADILPVKFYKNRNTELFSTGLLGYNFTRHPLFNWADVIHMHWVNSGFVNVKHLSGIKKPVIWTLRDMWPITGGCHISLTCLGYETGCGQCPQLGSTHKYDLSKYVIHRKRKYIPPNIVLVGISEWISECAIKSFLFKNSDVLTISNNVNCSDFFPVDRLVARNVIGLPAGRKIILAGAQRPDLSWKGFDKFLESLVLLKEENPFLLFFGNMDPQLLKQTGLEYKALGNLTDKIALRIAYSAADVFVSPSLMESFGKTLAESMACGTPVVCFGATGPKDIVDHQVNGYAAKPFDPQDLANGIRWVLHHPDGPLLSRNAIKKVLGRFDTPVIAKQYLNLYSRTLAKGTKQK